MNNKNESLEELLNQYDLLINSDITKNYSKYAELIGKVSLIDIGKALELWNFLLENKKEYLKNNNISMSITGFVQSKIMFLMSEKNFDLKSSRKEMFRLLRENPTIMNYCYGIAYRADYMFILECVKYGDKELAEKVFELIYNNPQKAFSNDELIIYIFKHFPLSVSSTELKYWNDSFEMFERWLERMLLPNNLSEANSMLFEFKKLLTKKEQNDEYIIDSKPKKRVNDEVQEKKIKKLVSSYDTLLNNFEKNRSYISEIIGKMSRYDINLAAEMWENVLKKHNDKLTDSDIAYSMCGGVCYSISQEIGDEELCLFFRNNPKIIEYCFGVCIDVYIYPIIDCLKYEFYEEAIKMFDLEMNNSKKINDNEKIMNNDEFIIEILSSLSDNSTDLNENAIDIIKMWAERIEDYEVRAKADVCIMILEDIFEENSKYNDDDYDDDDEYDEDDENS